MRIERVTTVDAVERAAELFDSAPLPDATTSFLAAPGHHLLLAYDDEGGAGSDQAGAAGAGEPIGMVTGVETTHPDKGTEMFVYELGVAPAARRRGVATALLRALQELAIGRGCYGMWVAVDTDNDIALATYARAGARDDGTCAIRGWTFRERDA